MSLYKGEREIPKGRRDLNIMTDKPDIIIIPAKHHITLEELKAIQAEEAKYKISYWDKEAIRKLLKAAQ